MLIDSLWEVTENMHQHNQVELWLQNATKDALLNLLLVHIFRTTLSLLSIPRLRPNSQRRSIWGGRLRVFTSFLRDKDCCYHMACPCHLPSLSNLFLYWFQQIGDTRKWTDGVAAQSVKHKSLRPGKRGRTLVYPHGRQWVPSSDHSLSSPKSWKVYKSLDWDKGTLFSLTLMLKHIFSHFGFSEKCVPIIWDYLWVNVSLGQIVSLWKTLLSLKRIRW